MGINLNHVKDQLKENYKAFATEYKNDLKKEMLFFSDVDTVDPATVRWNAIRFQRNNNTYRMLISLCQLVLEGMFICFICPTAAAVVVVTEKLGGSIGSLTTFTIIANIVTMLIIPFFFPMVERGAGITFFSAMLLVLRNVTAVLVAPLFLALLSRHIIPNFVNRLNKHKDLGFYIWCFNLSIITGITLHNIERSSITGWVLWVLMMAPLGVCLLQFGLGKLIGKRWNDSISAGQALGQKNTVVGIWLTLTFLNPLAAISPGAYVLWQNLVNGWQIWYKEKHGHVKW